MSMVTVCRRLFSNRGKRRGSGSGRGCRHRGQVGKRAREWEGGGHDRGGDRRSDGGREGSEGGRAGGQLRGGQWRCEGWGRCLGQQFYEGYGIHSAHCR